MIGLIGGRRARAAAAISVSVSAFGVAREACDFPKTEVSWTASHFGSRRRGGCFIREMVIIVMDRSVVSSPPEVVVRSIPALALTCSVTVRREAPFPLFP